MRALTPVATPANELRLLGLAECAPASGVERLARAWCRVDRQAEETDERRRHERRNLNTWVDDDAQEVHYLQSFEVVILVSTRSSPRHPSAPARHIDGGATGSGVRGRLLAMPSRDAQWIIGAVLLVGGLLWSQGAETNARLDRIETDIRNIDARLRGVEIEFGKVDQRLATLERLHLPTPNPAND